LFSSLPAEKELEHREHAGAPEHDRSTAHQQLGGNQAGAPVHVIDEDRAHATTACASNASTKRIVKSAGTGEASQAAAVNWSDVASRSIDATK
jgi:hypothetical protein